MPDNTTIGQRFTQLIQQLGLSKNAFAQSLDKTATVIQHLVDERNKPGYDLLCKVFEVYPNVSKDWLMEGRGPMLRAAATPELFVGSSTEAKANAVPAARAQATPVPDGIDLSEVPHAPRRRNGTLLQPADIAATLALAAHSPLSSGSGRATEPAAKQPAAEPPLVTPAPVSSVPLAPAPAVAPDPAYLAAALHTMQLQHQLALSEQRNQHLLEQQVLLKQLVGLLQKTV